MKQITIFCEIDDFCKAYEAYCRNRLLMNKKEVLPRTRMSLSEIMTRLIVRIAVSEAVIVNEIINFLNVSKIKGA